MQISAEIAQILQNRYVSEGRTSINRGNLDLDVTWKNVSTSYASSCRGISRYTLSVL